MRIGSRRVILGHRSGRYAFGFFGELTANASVKWRERKRQAPIRRLPLSFYVRLVSTRVASMAFVRMPVTGMVVAGIAMVVVMLMVVLVVVIMFPFLTFPVVVSALGHA